MGETYDARRALHGLGHARASTTASWDPVAVGAELKPAGPGASRPAGARRSPSSRPARSPSRSPASTCWTWARTSPACPGSRSPGEPGQKITLRFAERLNPDGTIYTTNLRAARCIDTYICAGQGEETWSPRFTFHGFQYVEITGLKSPPTPRHRHRHRPLQRHPRRRADSRAPTRCSTSCTATSYWTQRANFIDIPTDCPQRDERLGWTGDAQVYIRTATLNCDVQAFFTKWLVDLTDGQRADGQFPMVAPVKVAGDDGGPAWADAGVICPWTIYQVYGDRRLLERQYPSMVKFVEFCRKRSTPELLPPAQFHCFGDWLSIGADTPKDVIYTAYFALSTRLTAEAAEVLGKAEDAARLRELYQKIKAAFNKAYVATDGRIKGNTQAVYVLALAVDLVDGRDSQAGRGPPGRGHREAGRTTSPPASSAPRT